MNALEYILNRYRVNNGESPITLPNTSRNELAVLFKELGFTCGVEVGVWKGEFSKVLCETNPNLMLYSDDPWNTENFYETQADGDKS